jgi:hypothetical protein
LPRDRLSTGLDLCTVCAVSAGEIGSACPVGTTVISLDPSTLEQVAASIETLAPRLGVPERGRDLTVRCSYLSSSYCQ